MRNVSYFKVKCLQYWADSESNTYSDIVVTTVKEDIFLDYTIRVFHINEVSVVQKIIVDNVHHVQNIDLSTTDGTSRLDAMYFGLLGAGSKSVTRSTSERDCLHFRHFFVVSLIHLR